MTQGDQKGMNQTLSRKDSASIQRSARELSQKKSLFYQLGYVALTNVCLIKDGDDDPGDHTIIVWHSRVQRYELFCNSNLCEKA